MVVASLMPRPHLLTRKRVRWLLSDFLVVLSQQSWFGQSNEIVPRHPSMPINQWNRPYVMQAYNQCLFKINTAESAQPRSHSIPDRFPHERTGSGHETRELQTLNSVLCKVTQTCTSHRESYTTFVGNYKYIFPGIWGPLHENGDPFMKMGNPTWQILNQ